MLELWKLPIALLVITMRRQNNVFEDMIFALQ